MLKEKINEVWKYFEKTINKIHELKIMFWHFDDEADYEFQLHNLGINRINRNITHYEMMRKRILMVYDFLDGKITEKEIHERRRECVSIMKMIQCCNIKPSKKNTLEKMKNLISEIDLMVDECDSKYCQLCYLIDDEKLKEILKVNHLVSIENAKTFHNLTKYTAMIYKHYNEKE